MKKLLSLFLFSTFLLPSSLAFYAIADEEEVTLSEALTEDAYLAGESVRISESIDGDLFAAGNKIFVEKEVTQDATLFGNEVMVNANIGDDLRTGGAKVWLQQSIISGDAFIAGGEIYIGKDSLIKSDLTIGGGVININGNVEGDLKVGGDKVVITGIVNGDATIYAEEIVFRDNAQVKGNLNYYLPEAGEFEAFVGGSITHDESLHHVKGEADENGFEDIFSIYTFLYLLIFGSLMFFGFEKFMTQTGGELGNRPWMSLFKGFLFLVATPIAAILLMVTVIGIPVGLFVLSSYVFTIVLFELIGVAVFAGFIVFKFPTHCKTNWKKFGLLALLSVIFTLISGFDFIIALFALGALVTTEMNVWKTLR